MKKQEYTQDEFLLCINKSPILLLLRILLGIILIDVLLLFIFFFTDFVNIEYQWFFSIYSFEEHIIILFMLLHIVVYLYLFISWVTEYYKISHRKVVHTQGIFFKKTTTFLVENLNSISVYKSFWWRIFHYGNITFFYTEKSFIFKNIPYPDKFVKIIELFREKTNINK